MKNQQNYLSPPSKAVGKANFRWHGHSPQIIKMQYTRLKNDIVKNITVPSIINAILGTLPIVNVAKTMYDMALSVLIINFQFSFLL